MNENTNPIPPIKNPFVAIASVISAMSVGIVAIVAALASEHFHLAAWIIGALAVMGIGLGFFASRKS
ncbi:MAG: hypothetical protein ACYS8X_14495 [Planctomycetota bacterium]